MTCLATVSWANMYAADTVYDQISKIGWESETGSKSYFWLVTCCELAEKLVGQLFPRLNYCLFAITGTILNWSLFKLLILKNSLVLNSPLKWNGAHTFDSLPKMLARLLVLSFAQENPLVMHLNSIFIRVKFDQKWITFVNLDWYSKNISLSSFW